jgi:hypothetical protein
LDIHIPDGILSQLQKSLLANKGRQEELAGQQRRSLEHRLARVHRRVDLAYQDKLDGKISDELWERNSSEWQTEEQQLLASMQVLDAARPERLDAARILELANKAYSLYVRQSPAEQAKLLKIVLSNCAIDAVSIYPTYRKPFDLIFQQAKT